MYPSARFAAFRETGLVGEERVGGTRVTASAAGFADFGFGLDDVASGGGPDGGSMAAGASRRLALRTALDLVSDPMVVGGMAGMHGAEAGVAESSE